MHLIILKCQTDTRADRNALVSSIFVYSYRRVKYYLLFFHGLFNEVKKGEKFYTFTTKCRRPKILLFVCLLNLFNFFLSLFRHKSMVNHIQTISGVERSNLIICIYRKKYLEEFERGNVIIINNGKIKEWRKICKWRGRYIQR